MPRKLKVFQARLGFFDTVVAAANQAAALRAWGIHQNLFAEGEAKVAEDEAAISAALAHPGKPLRRAAGSRDAFELEPKGLPAAPASRGPRRTSRLPARPHDRSHLDAAEAKLRELDEKWETEKADLHRRETSLKEEARRASAANAAARKEALKDVGQARRAYRRAGGDA